MCSAVFFRLPPPFTWLAAFLQPCPRCGSREDVWCVKRGSLLQAQAHKSPSFSSPVLGIAASSTAEEKCEIKINIIKCREGCGSGARAGKAAWETEPWPRMGDNPRFLLWWCVSSQQMTRVLSKHSPVQLAQRESECEPLGSEQRSECNFYYQTTRKCDNRVMIAHSSFLPRCFTHHHRNHYGISRSVLKWYVYLSPSLRVARNKCFQV